VRFTPPTHSSGYDITVRVLVDDVEVPGSYNVFVSTGGLSANPGGAVQVDSFKTGIESEHGFSA
jgi:hypothetical protein